MAAEALIVEDAYQRGYADAIADMRKKKEQRRQREQAKKARRWYFIKQKAYGLAMLAVTVLAAAYELIPSNCISEMENLEARR